MGSHHIDELFYATEFFLSFYKYWPDDGLVRPKLDANTWNNKIKRRLWQTEYMFYLILILSDVLPVISVSLTCESKYRMFSNLIRTLFTVSEG